MHLWHCFRHHIVERSIHALFWWRSWTNVCYLLPVGIIFLNVCSLTLAPSSGPDIRMFKCFQSSWADIVHAAFHAGLEDIKVTRKITLGKRPEVLNFVRTMTSGNSATRIHVLPGTAHSDHRNS